MNCKHVGLALLFAVVYVSCLAQQTHLENYTQEIAGSDLTISMIAIPAGNFMMGRTVNSENGRDDEEPANQVHLEAFWMSNYEITWDLYNLFINRAIDGAENLKKGAEVSIDVDAVAGATIPYVDMSLGMGTSEDLPVGNVTHLAATKFCKWLSAKTGYIYRLPTEAEWEYAARAGTTTPYFFNDASHTLDEYAWYEGNSKDTYHKVGQKKPNPWGLYDMYGNVAEWTLDQYKPDAYANRGALTLAPLEIPIKRYPHSVRGGSYKDAPENLRSAARMFSTADWIKRDPQFPKSIWWNTDAPFVGFRIVRVPKTPTEAESEIFWGSKL